MNDDDLPELTTRRLWLREFLAALLLIVSALAIIAYFVERAVF